MTHHPVVEAESVAEYVAARAGIRLSCPRRREVLLRVVDAMADAGVTSAADFRKVLEGDARRFDDLVVTLTVGESYFFREPVHLELLRRHVLPERSMVRGPGGRVRVWSAGCAAGQEAYTLAIVLQEEGLALRSHVLATDISPDALQKARTGLYGKWSLRALDDRRRQVWFQPTADGFRISPRLTRGITFRQHNLLDPGGPPARDLDVVMCRNVLVYFTPPAVEAVGRRLLEALAPGGWIITAATDPRLEGIDGLGMIATPEGTAYRRLTDDSNDGRSARAAPAYERPAVRHVGSGGAAGVGRTQVRPGPPSPSTRAPGSADAAGAAQAADRLAAARSALAAGNYERAASQAAELAGGDLDGGAAVVLVRALGSAGRLAAASDAAADAVQRLPLQAELRLLHAIVLLEREMPDEAAAAARAALYVDARLTMAHLTLARAERARGDNAAALRSYRNAETLLEAMPAQELVPLSDGETAGRLVELARASQRLVHRSAASTVRR